jgi:hypothetical protein
MPDLARIMALALPALAAIATAAAWLAWITGTM